MPVSKIQICNKALQKLGVKRISSIDPLENSKQARSVDFAYDMVRRQALTSADWRFAGKRASLAADSTTPEWKYGRRYLLPSDSIRIRAVDTSCPWEQVGGHIETDAEAPLKVAYTFDQTDTTVYTPGFVDFFATLLAIELVEELTQSGTTQDRLRDRLNREVANMAMPVDADQGTPDEAVTDEWLSVRA